MKKINKKIFLIIINVLIIILEIIGIVLNYKELHTFGIQYYTEDSNFLLLIASIISLIYLVLNKRKLPRCLEIFKYTSVVCVSVTFLVVVFMLAPSIKDGYNQMLLQGSMLYHHLLCPVLAIIMFLFLDDYKLNNRKEILYSMSFSIIYSLIITLLNLFKILEGPYFFLLVYKNPIYMSIIYFIVILGGTYLLSFGLNKLKIKLLS